MSGIPPAKSPLDNVDTTPTFPVSGEVQVRITALAQQFAEALRQGYIDQNVLSLLLSDIKALAPSVATALMSYLGG